MRTARYGIHLFDDKVYKNGHHIYMKRKVGEREQDSGETERESECERWCVVGGGGNVRCKNNR